MIRLIKNELTKIFHKKAIYIMLIITLGFMILGCVLDKFLQNNYIYEEDTSYYEEQLATLDKNNPEEKSVYEMYQANIEVAKLRKKYDYDSWQRYVIDMNGFDIIQNMYQNEGDEKYKKQYDDFIKKLESDDWKYFATEQLKEINKEIEYAKQNNQDLTPYEIQKQALDWRLEKDISFAQSNLHQMIQEWITAKQSYLEIENRKKTGTLNYNEEVELQRLKGEVSILEYGIENITDSNIEITNINENLSLSTIANMEAINSVSDYSLYIIILVVIIAGTIISEEFNKGTVKLLLVRPYKRTKILVAKFISCLIILLIAIITVIALQTIIGGISNGFNEYNNQNIIYNYNTNSVETVGLLKFIIISTLSFLPKIILLMALAFTLSVVFNNSPVAIALPLLGLMGEPIINQLAYSFEKAKFLMYFVTPNWDLRIFLFGKLPEFEPISLPFAITICIIYFVIMAIISTIVFKRRDIKNV